MASLADTIKLNSGLASASSEELAALQGRKAAPISPLETGVIGGNPDQAKMAGTPNQQISSLRQALQGTQDLSTAQRLGQKQGTATSGEAADMAQVKKLKGLSSLDTRVEELTNKLISEKAAGGQAAQLATAGGDPEINKLLARIRDNPNDFEAIRLLNVKLGKTNANDMITGPDLLAMYGETDKLIAAQIGNTVGQAIQAGKLPIQEMGFKSVADLAGALETDEKSVTGMTIPQLIQKINQITQTEFQKTATLEARANDPRLGAAERAEARKQLRDMGAVGIRSAETDVDKLADQIANADKVEFMGTQVPVDQLLGNEYMSGVVAEYLDGLDPTTGLPTSEYSKLLAKTQPKLVEFIQKNKTVLEATKNQVADSVKKFADQQIKNKAIATSVKTGESLPDELMSKLFADWGKARSAPYDISKYPFLQAINDSNTTPEQANSLIKFARTVFEQWPGMVSEFSSLSRQELARIGALGDTNNYAQFNDIINESRKIRDMKTKDDMARLLGVNSLGEMEKLRANIIRNANFGTGDKTLLTNIPGLAEGDYDKMFAWLQKQRPGNLKAIINRLGSSIADKTKQIRDAGGKALDLIGDLEKVFATKTKIDETDYRKYIGNPDPKDEYAFVLKNKDKLSYGAYTLALARVKTRFNDMADKAIKSATDGVSTGKLLDLVNNTTFATREDADKVGAQIDKAIAAYANFAAENNLPKEWYREKIGMLTKAKSMFRIKEQERVVKEEVKQQVEDIKNVQETGTTEAPTPVTYTNIRTGETISAEEYMRRSQPRVGVVFPNWEWEQSGAVLPASSSSTPSVNDNVVQSTSVSPGTLRVGTSYIPGLSGDSGFGLTEAITRGSGGDTSGKARNRK